MNKNLTKEQKNKWLVDFIKYIKKHNINMTSNAISSLIKKHHDIDIKPMTIAGIKAHLQRAENKAKKVNK